MFIRLIDTIQWFEQYQIDNVRGLLNLADILPIIGKSYSFPLHPSQHQLNDGKAFCVWKPPLSDLEGWAEGRSSDILKSYLVEGVVETQTVTENQFNFTVRKFERLVDTFLKRTRNVGKQDNYQPSLLGWGNAEQTTVAYVDDLIYLNGLLSQEVWGELILSKESGSYVLHYCSYLPAPSIYETVIIDVLLEDQEVELIDSVIINAQPIVEKAIPLVSDDKVWGM